MESLAFLSVLILLFIYSSALIAFGLSWIRHLVGKIFTIVFAVIGLITGIWISITLMEGNGILIGLTPILLSGIAIWNTFRINKPAKP